MNIFEMVVTIYLFYKPLLALRSFHLFMSSVNMHVTFSYILEISVTLPTFYLAILLNGVLGCWIYWYLWFGWFRYWLSLSFLTCTLFVFLFHVLLEVLIVLFVASTELTFPVLSIKMFINPLCAGATFVREPV